MADEGFVHIMDMIPDGCMPLHAIRLVEFLDEDGESGFKFKVDGDVHLATTIGMLHIAMQHYIENAYSDND